MATPQTRDLILHSPAGADVIRYVWPLQIGSGSDKHDNGIDIIETIRFVCEDIPEIRSTFEEINFNELDTACYKTMTSFVERFNKAIESIKNLEKGTSLPSQRLNKFASPNLLRHILQLVYNAAVIDPDKLNQYEPFSPEVYGETSYELIQQMIKQVNAQSDDTFIDLGSGVGQVVLQMAGSVELKACIGIEKADVPSSYSQFMDSNFRLWMNWFGKRYGEYHLIKGDFLADEHREKITSSSLVFVNNFAFGPTVDHHLKERFADLRDGARIVSSKSFCPLNFRITERNLSDIGTIMHVSEMTPLKGSVSWTGKPVSYYLHKIDRTKLERYFQRLKIQKGTEHESNGTTTRTTRERSKRNMANSAINNNNNNNIISNNNNINIININNEDSNLENNNKLNNNLLNISNSNSNNSSNNMSTSNASTPTVTPTPNSTPNITPVQTPTPILTIPLHTECNNNLSKDSFNKNNIVKTDALITIQQTVDSDSSSPESDTDQPAGTQTRRGWYEWYSSSKDKSSQSDDEENNNYRTSSLSNGKRKITVTQKKRKKLLRKAAVTAALKTNQVINNGQHEKVSSPAMSSGNKSTPVDTIFRSGKRGRVKKGRGKRCLKIAGLDILHTQTLLSTSAEMMSKKLPAAPGCVDQQLTSLSGNMYHEELDIPKETDTPYSLQILLDNFRAQYMAVLEQMKNSNYKRSVNDEIKKEQDHKEILKNRINQLDKQIKVLIEDSVNLLKARMNELGISMTSQNDLLAKAKEIVGRHKELQMTTAKLTNQVTKIEQEQRILIENNLKALLFKNKFKNSNGINIGNNEVNLSNELTPAASHELVLKEIANTLSQRKKLHSQVSNLEVDIKSIEKSAEEKKQAALILAQQSPHLTITNVTPNVNHHHREVLRERDRETYNNQYNSSHHNNSNVNHHNSNTTERSSKSTSHSKSSRRNREHRTRSQEWPDVPDVGKIEENNPEILAQKILETGRKIEAGKLNAAGVTCNNNNNNNNTSVSVSYSSKHKEERKHNISTAKDVHHNQHNLQNGPDSALMPAPPSSNLKQPHIEHQLRNEHHRSNEQARNNVNIVQNRHTTKLPSSVVSPVTPIQIQVSNHPQVQAVSVTPPIAATAKLMQESPKVVNFEDRLKSIITTALNEDQEQRKQAATHPTEPKKLAQASPPPQIHLRNDGFNSSSKIATIQHPTQSVLNDQQRLSSHQQHQSHISNNINSILNVATQGPTHLNSTTTISPITPPLYSNQGPLPSSQTSVSNHLTRQEIVTGPFRNNSAANMYNSERTSNREKERPSIHPPQAASSIMSGAMQSNTTPMQHSIHSSNPNNLHKYYTKNLPVNVSPNQATHQNLLQQSSHPSIHQSAHQTTHQPSHQLVLQQQHQTTHPVTHQSLHQTTHQQNHPTPQQQPNLHSQPQIHSQGQPLLAANAPVMHGQAHMANQSQSLAYTTQQQIAADLMYRRSFEQHCHSSQERLEFKTPDQMRYDKQGFVEENVRSSSASSDSAMYYSSRDRDRLIPVGGANSNSNPCTNNVSSQAQSQHLQQPSRPSSSSSQPDYTQVSPAKMALRRHLSQEKLNQHQPGNGLQQHTSAMSKTIGDLVNGEIERTLEISHQSIINAAINMSTVGASSDRLLINPNAQRPERVNVRVMDDASPFGSQIVDSSHRQHQQQHQQQQNQLPIQHSLHLQQQQLQQASHNQHQMQRNNNIEMERKSPIQYVSHNSNQNNLSTLAHVAYNQKIQHQQSIYNNSVHSSAPNNSNSSSRRHVSPSSSRNAYKQNYERHTTSQHQQHHNLHQHNAQTLQSGRSIVDRNYSTVPLPRTEIKPYLESYFTDEQKSTEEHPLPARIPRMINPPLEGLAASLQARVIASLKIKEENEERLRRSESNYANSTLSNNSAVKSSHLKSEVGIKRTSPIVNHHRPPKMPYYAEQQSIENPMLTSTPLEISSVRISTSTASNPYTNSGTSASIIGIGATSRHPVLRETQILNANIMDPPLMSPEINSLTTEERSVGSVGPERSNSAASGIHNSRTGRNEDDDVLPDDESGWQDRVSSGFDRLVAFASTELDKTRRSIDNDTAPSISCNTSPDSGIAHSSSSEARTFLSTSSSSSHIDLPTNGANISATPDGSSSTCLVASSSGIVENTIEIGSNHLTENLSSGNRISSGINAGSNSSISSIGSSLHCKLEQTSLKQNINKLVTKNNPLPNMTSKSLISNQNRLNNIHHSSNHLDNLEVNASNTNLMNNNNFNNNKNNNNNNNINSNNNNNNNSRKLLDSIPSVMKNISSVDQEIESPPLSESCLPRTPSPSSTPPIPNAISSLYSNSGNSNAGLKTTASISTTHSALGGNIAVNSSNSSTGPGQVNLKIPLKYQRQSKVSSEKHFKKKFRERTWEYDYDDLYDGMSSQDNQTTINSASASGSDELNKDKTQLKMNLELNSNSGSNNEMNVVNKYGGNSSDGSSMPHKASKFRPKGKDWGWSNEKTKMNSEDSVVM